MAQAPNRYKVERQVKAALRAEEKKLQAQQKLGKTFVNNGQGIIPESIWKNLPGKKWSK